MNKNLNTKFINALKKIEILSLDTDGVLTDGGLYYTEEGTELRKFNVTCALPVCDKKSGTNLLIFIMCSPSPLKLATPVD